MRRETKRIEHTPSQPWFLWLVTPECADLDQTKITQSHDLPAHNEETQPHIVTPELNKRDELILWC